MPRLSAFFLLVPLALVSSCSGCASQKDARDLAGPSDPADPSDRAPNSSADATSSDAKTPATEVVVAPPPPTPTPDPDSPPPSLDALRPWFSTPPFAAALADWHAAAMAATPEDADLSRTRALDVFGTTLEPDDTRAAPARFMAAWIESERALDPIARVAVAARFEGIADAWPLMADVALVQAARLYEAGGSFDSALTVLERIENLTAESAGSIHRAEALELRAALLIAQGQSPSALALLESAAKKNPAALTASAWQHLADLRVDPAQREHARFELAHRFPADPLGKAALEALDRSRLSASDKLVLGRALFENHRYDSLRALLVGFVKRTPEACEAWTLLGKALERTNRKKKDKAVNDRAFAFYEKALACEGEPRADATFLGGRNRLAKGDTKLAKKLLSAHVADFPARSTADDAKLLLAQEEERASNKAATKSLLKTLRRYPTGDMADSVAWALIAPHLEKRRWAPMLDLLDQILALSPNDIPGRHAGRYRYWRGRALWELDRKDEARVAWREVFLRHPLSWYAILAYSRLQADNPASVADLVAQAAGHTPSTDGAEPSDPADLDAEAPDEAAPESYRSSPSPSAEPSGPASGGPAGPAAALRDRPAVGMPTPTPAPTPTPTPESAPESAPELPMSTATPTPPPASTIPAALWKNPHFRRAVEWARLAGGRYDEPSPFADFIDRELAAVPRSARPDPTAWSWLRVEVQQLGGAWSRSMRLARTSQAVHPMPFPVGDAARPWRLAYPQPFAEHIVRWATERGIPPSWIWGVMRVESNFEPTAVSWANAVGLMQIILPTAKSLVRDTPYAPTRENLMRPSIAVELGTKYLAKLLERHKVFPLAAAGYNAGGGAVGKWRRQFGDVDVDEFVERIPYREAHLYAKSVTQTFARYLWLYEGELLLLDLRPVGHPDAAAAPTE